MFVPRNGPGRRRAVLASSLAQLTTGLALLLLAGQASAQGKKGDAGAPASKMAAAQADFDELDKSLVSASGQDCATMCKALESLSRAAERICVLAKDGGDADKKRCENAKARLEEATKRVRAACPACVGATTPSPIEAAGKKGVPKEEPTISGTTTVPPSPPPSPKDAGKLDMDEAPAYGEASSVAFERRRRRFLTLALSPVAFVWPAYSLRLGLEVGLPAGLSLGVDAGFGGAKHAGGKLESVLSLGAALRLYPTRDGFRGSLSGPFLGVQSSWAKESRGSDDAQVAPKFVLGPMLGWKVVLDPGFTFEPSAGFGVVLSDGRTDGGSALVPTWQLRIGWTF
jgi:hypothetical protein